MVLSISLSEISAILRLEIRASAATLALSLRSVHRLLNRYRKDIEARKALFLSAKISTPQSTARAEEMRSEGRSGAARLLKILDDPALLAGQTTIGWAEIAAGFGSAFLVAMVVIRAFVAYVSRRGFAPFAWYRIVVGGAAIVWLTMR